MLRSGFSRRSILVAGLGAASLGAAGVPALGATPRLKLDDRQMGQLAFIDAIARQLPGDWSHMGAEEPGQGDFDSYRYQLAMMSYTLSLAHYHYTPAWRDRHHETSRLLIEKMLRFDVWGYWEMTSRGAKLFDPDLQQLGPGWIDPVRSQNIMYSGHLYQMVATHHMLFGAGEFEKPGSILFEYDPVARGMGKQTFSYDIHALTSQLLDLFRLSGWRGIECEPNAIFPECNQHPILALKLYDALYGTNHFRDVGNRFMERFETLGYLGENSSYLSFLLVKQNETVRWDEAWGDGWTGTFLHGWNRGVAARAYAAQKPRFISRVADGLATIRMPERQHGYSHGHGFMATVAAEVGNEEMRDALLSYADAYWNPTWDGEALFYPRNDNYRHVNDADGIWRRVQPLTANGLLGLARMGGRDRLFEMFDRPRTSAQLREPCLERVDYPAVHVRHAKFDRLAETLHVTLRPGRKSSAAFRTSLSISNLDRGRRFKLATSHWGDVRDEALLDGREADVRGRWNENRLDVEMQIEGEVDFTFQYL